MSTRPKRQKICPNFSTLPRDVTITILSKLQHTTILRCRVVCKEWRDIVTSDRTFAKTHYEKNKNSLSLVCPRAIMDGCKNKKSKTQRGWFYKLDPYRFNGIVSPDEFSVVNSCKGFLLMESCVIEDPEAPRTYVVYNPLTNETLFLPMGKRFSCGLGFSPVTKQFKVVAFALDRKRSLTLQIYTIGNGDSGTGAWRSVSLPAEGTNPQILNLICHEKNKPIELNGVLHWHVSLERIASFDVEKEELGQMPTPWFGYSRKCVSSIGVYKGLLCLGISVQGSSRVEMWVMKEYGMKDSWMRYVVVKEALASKSIYGPNSFTLGSPKLVEILESGEMIFLATQLKDPRRRFRDPFYYHLFSYDPIKECFEKLRWFSKEYSKMIIDVYTPSFLTLKETAKLSC